MFHLSIYDFGLTIDDWRQGSVVNRQKDADVCGKSSEAGAARLDNSGAELRVFADSLRLLLREVFIAIVTMDNLMLGMGNRFRRFAPCAILIRQGLPQDGRYNVRLRQQPRLQHLLGDAYDHGHSFGFISLNDAIGKTRRPQATALTLGGAIRVGLYIRDLILRHNIDKTQLYFLINLTKR
jgi:hypothetical protein